MAGGSEGRSLALTPSWVIAIVCGVFIIISFMVERAIHRLSHWLKDTKRKSLFKALEKMKEELMLLGFISLLVTVTQYYVVKICLPASVLKKWTPCAAHDEGSGIACGATAAAKSVSKVDASGRGLLESGLAEFVQRRFLAGEGEATDACQGGCSAGRQPLISMEGIHQLHIFIFVLAVVHVVYSALTMVLSRLRIHFWKKWEVEVHADSHENLREHTRALTMSRQSTFLRYHTSTPWSRNRFFLWIVCLFRQFYGSVTQADYLALRLGFISNHNLDKKFDFYTYMLRAVEDEYKEIVGISASMWGYVIIFMLFNVHGSDFYFWISLVPPLMLLIIGTKLQHVIATLAIESVGPADEYAPHTVQPRDQLFWFKDPRFVLRLIHFILFQNAFELATLFWFWWQFSLKSCFLEHKVYSITRLLFGVSVQVVCSHTTLPLYALVSQMGSSYKLGGDVKGALHGWRKRAQKRLGVLDVTNRGSSHEDRDSSTPGPQSGRQRVITNAGGHDVELQIAGGTPRP